MRFQHDKERCEKEGHPCNGCLVVKPLDEFYLATDRRCGHSSWCIPCDKAKMARWKADNWAQALFARSWFDARRRGHKPIRFRHWPDAPAPSRSSPRNGYDERWGLVEFELEEKLYLQGGVCFFNRPEAPCAVDETKRLNGLVVDHDHRTGWFRALLCLHCNTRESWVEGREERVLELWQLGQDDPPG